MVDNKIRTARELQDLASSVDQYPGLSDFAEAQVTPVLQHLRTSQQAAQGLLASTQKLSDLINTATERATKLDMMTDSQPFTTLGRLTTVGAEARPGELKELAGVLASNAAQLSSILEATQGAFGTLTQEYNSLANQVETLEQSPAKEAPAQEDTSTMTSTGEPGTQYVYE